MRLRRIGCGTALIAVVVFLAISTGPEPPVPNPPGTFAFAVLGDAPYYPWEEPKYRLVRRALDANDLAFVIHVGDIFWKPCTDSHYRQVRIWFDNMRHPVVYTPGDNETYDCWQSGSGGFAPQERWASLRRVFFDHPAQSLGRTPMPLVSQGGEFAENARWSYRGFVFATVDMIGSKNGKVPFAKRTAEDDAASRRRTEAAAAWVRSTFAEAKRTNAPAVVIAFHANADLEEPPNDYRDAFEPFLATLEAEARQFGRPVLVVHGDGHKYVVDHPLPRARNLTRMQVPGSPRVGWVRVVVRPGAADPFEMAEHVVPSWKYW